MMTPPDTSRHTEPRTEAGKALLFGPDGRESMRDAIIAIEREARDQQWNEVRPMLREARLEGSEQGIRATLEEWRKERSEREAAAATPPHPECVEAYHGELIRTGRTIMSVARVRQDVAAAERGRAAAATPLLPDPEDVARVLHQMGFVYYAGMADHEPFGQCFCSDARREDARDFLARLRASAGSGEHACNHGLSAHGDDGCIHCDCKTPGFRASIGSGEGDHRPLTRTGISHDRCAVDGEYWPCQSVRAEKGAATAWSEADKQDYYRGDLRSNRLRPRNPHYDIPHRCPEDCPAGTSL